MPRRLGHSDNLMDNRPALAAVGNGVMTVFSGDARRNQQTAQARRPVRHRAQRGRRRAAFDAARRSAAPAADAGDRPSRTRPTTLPASAPTASSTRARSCACSAASSIATPSTPPTATATACWRIAGAMPSTPAISTGWATATTTTATTTNTPGGRSRRWPTSCTTRRQFVAMQSYERSVKYPERPSQRHVPEARHPPLAARQPRGHGGEGHARTRRSSTSISSTSAASAPRTPAPPTWAPTGATTIRWSSRSSRFTRATATTTNSRRAALGDEEDADRRLRAEGLRRSTPSTRATSSASSRPATTSRRT